jgi:type III secretion protein D
MTAANRPTDENDAMTEATLEPVWPTEAAMSPRYKLRVLSGALGGREFCLVPGNWAIGGPDADLAVVLESDQSAILEIDEKGVYLRSAVDCWIAGRRTEVSGALPHRIPIDLAGLVVVLGEVGTELSEIRAVPRRAPIQWLTGGGVAFAILAAGIAIGALVVFVPEASEQTRAQAHAEWLTRITKEFAKQHVTVGVDKDGVLQLSGHCADSGRVDLLRDELRQRQITFSDNAVCTSDIAGEIQATLSLYGYPNVSVRSSSVVGRYEIVGAINNDSGWNAVEDQLRHIPGLSSWEVRDVLGSYSVDVVSAIRDAGLGSYVSVVPAGQGIAISGELSPERLAILERLLAKLRDGANGELSISYEDIPVDNVIKNIFDSPIVTYIGNAISPSVELGNGLVLREGSIIANGYTVSRLDADGIDLSRDRRLIHLPSAPLSNDVLGRAEGLHVPDLP